jgi:hypothetical protein
MLCRDASKVGKHLVSIRLQMKAPSANQEVVIPTKQTKIDQCERVRVNFFSKPPQLRFSLPHHRGSHEPSVPEGSSCVLLILLLILDDLRLFQILMNAEDNFKSSSPGENKRHTNAHQPSPPSQQQRIQSPLSAIDKTPNVYAGFRALLLLFP